MGKPADTNRHRLGAYDCLRVNQRTIMVTIEKQDGGLAITNQNTGKRAKSKKAHWVLQYGRWVNTIKQAYEWCVRASSHQRY